MLEKSTQPTGLPDIAQSTTPSRHTVLIVLSMIGILMVLWWAWGQSVPVSQKKATLVDERYTIPNAISSGLREDSGLPEAGETPLAPLQKTTVPEDSMQQTSQIDTTLQDIETQHALIEAMEKERQARLAAPVMVVQRNSQSASTGETKTTAQKKTSDSVTEQFETPTPHVLSAVQQMHRETLLSEGTLIPAVLESAIDSDLPGLIRAMVESPVYSDDGSKVLIEAGSRLIGEYQANIAQGQERVFVIWSTMISPKGVRVPLASQGVDSLGRAGLAADSIHRHFWERFGNATMLSLIGAGASNIGVHGQEEQNASQVYREAMSQSFAQSATDAYQQQGNIPPTLQLKPGKTILIFVAHPLDFSQVFHKATG